jgi:hypothetical protein
MRGGRVRAGPCRLVRRERRAFFNIEAFRGCYGQAWSGPGHESLRSGRQRGFRTDAGSLAYLMSAVAEKPEHPLTIDERSWIVYRSLAGYAWPTGS